MSDEAPPKAVPLIVVVAFDRDDDGELQTVFGPMDFQSPDRAKRMAQSLAGKHAGVICWSRPINPALGEYGEPTVLFQAGDVPDME